MTKCGSFRPSLSSQLVSVTLACTYGVATDMIATATVTPYGMFAAFDREYIIPK